MAVRNDFINFATYIIAVQGRNLHSTDTNYCDFKQKPQ